MIVIQRFHFESEIEIIFKDIFRNIVCKILIKFGFQ